MRVAILETGTPPPALVPEFGTYADMTRHLFGAAHRYETIPVSLGAALPTPDAFDAYAITGSSAGAYDSLPWIAPLEAFLRAAKGRAKLVGICFGHQILAQALGGRVAKAPQGWGLGLHRYAIDGDAPWLDGPASVSGTASHQDQVIVPPPGSRTLAASSFTPHAMLTYGDDALSFQFHPEFAPAFSRALFTQRRVPGLPQAQHEAAIASLDRPNDNARVGGWIDRFLRG